MNQNEYDLLEFLFLNKSEILEIIHKELNLYVIYEDRKEKQLANLKMFLIDHNYNLENIDLEYILKLLTS